MIYRVNQLTGFYIFVTLAVKGLNLKEQEIQTHTSRFPQRH